MAAWACLQWPQLQLLQPVKSSVHEPDENIIRLHFAIPLKKLKIIFCTQWSSAFFPPYNTYFSFAHVFLNSFHPSRILCVHKATNGVWL